MDTRTIHRVEITSRVEDFQLGFWKPNETGEDGEWIPIPPSSQEIHEAAARQVVCSTELIDMLGSNISELVDYISEDLKDIWQRLDKIEGIH